MSSALTQVTVVPALTVKVGGSKVKLAIRHRRESRGHRLGVTRNPLQGLLRPRRRTSAR
jgi:hypothetical protein